MNIFIGYEKQFTAYERNFLNIGFFVFQYFFCWTYQKPIRQRIVNFVSGLLRN